MKIDCISSVGVPSNTPNGYPPNFPDMNPIELVFGYWHSEVTLQNPRNIDQVETYVLETS